ncbi:MAG TPA: hypothetical protein VKY26_09555, partial [Actinomycetota bacterium]|nr:hypothetical protein [Actinomycetota bacterium]
DGAQVIIDTYLASAERKWGQGSGLVLLLPHGYDGQGPDHSSARLERFLQLTGEGNLRVIVPTTAAQYFHALRQQAYQRPPVPLVVMTPKSLLRLAAARSPAGDLTGGAFEEVLGDPAPPEEVRRLVLTQGKLYYDLVSARDQRKAPVAIVRLEQPYPFPASALREQLGYYPGAEVCWAQEEPENMGSWRFLQPLFAEELAVPVRVIARPPAASPATGNLRVHVGEQQSLVERALGGPGPA